MDAQRIANLWADYYESLFSLLDEETFNNQSFIDVNKGVDEIYRASAGQFNYTFSTSLNTTEIEAVIKGLPDGKSPGYDGFSYEHLKYDGEILIQVLLKFYNRIIEIEEIPRSFKLAIKIPILMGNKKARSLDNHRGISC